LGEAATGIERAEGSYRIQTEQGMVGADHVVLALPIPALRQLIEGSSSLDEAPFCRQVESLELTRPFAVLRLWLDRLVERPPFVGTTGVGLLDNISVYDLFEDESRRWRDRTGGSILELHAYAVPPGWDEDSIRSDLVNGLHSLYPETREATILHERYLLRQDCPAFKPGSHADRPTVATPWPGLTLAGDFIRLPFPSALMERATASGMLAANLLLAPLGVRSETLETVPQRGMLAPLF